MVRPTGVPLSRCGKFGELAHGVADLARSLAFWQGLGFEISYQSDGPPYPWAILNDGLIILGLHKTDEFRGPNLTYFAPDMAERLVGLKADGIELIPVMRDGEGPLANAAVRGPDGESFLLFTGDI